MSIHTLDEKLREVKVFSFYKAFLPSHGHIPPKKQKLSKNSKKEFQSTVTNKFSQSIALRL